MAHEQATTRKPIHPLAIALMIYMAGCLTALPLIFAGYTKVGFAVLWVIGAAILGLMIYRFTVVRDIECD